MTATRERTERTAGIKNVRIMDNLLGEIVPPGAEHLARLRELVCENYYFLTALAVSSRISTALRA